MVGAFKKRKSKKRKSIEKGIRNLKKRIAEHEDKLRDLDEGKAYQDMPEREREGLRRHWAHEIQTFKKNIKDLENQLDTE